MSAIVITCPECDTSYRTEADSIGENGRTVRCAKCKSTWFVPAPLSEADLEADRMALEDAMRDEDIAVVEKPDPDDRSEDLFARPTTPAVARPTADVLMRDRADAAKLARRRRTIAIIWLIPLLLVIIAAILAFLYRQPIVNRIPQSATLYQTVGIEVRANGLEIDPPIAKTAIVDGAAVVMIESRVRNLSSRRLDVPLIELTLHDSAGASLAQWYVEPERTSLRPKGQLAFATEYPNPPVDAVGLRYRFAE